jgi:hypothetical protein
MGEAIQHLLLNRGELRLDGGRIGRRRIDHAALRKSCCMSTRRQPSAEVTPVEAHDGLSGAIAERAGFRGVWASGLSISCPSSSRPICSRLGHRDANEASWTQVVTPSSASWI